MLRARPQSLSGGGGDLAPPSAARVGGRQVARCAHLATTCRRSAGAHCSRGVGARFALVEMLADWRPACLEPNVCSLTEARGLASSVERVSFTRPARCNGGGGGGGASSSSSSTLSKILARNCSFRSGKLGQKLGARVEQLEWPARERKLRGREENNWRRAKAAVSNEFSIRPLGGRLAGRADEVAQIYESASS